MLPTIHGDQGPPFNAETLKRRCLAPLWPRDQGCGDRRTTKARRGGRRRRRRLLTEELRARATRALAQRRLQAGLGDPPLGDRALRWPDSADARRGAGPSTP